MPVLFSGVGILLIGLVINYLSTSFNEAEASITLSHEDDAITDLGRVVYAENCASCHGVALEGQVNWRQRGADGCLRATT